MSDENHCPLVSRMVNGTQWIYRATIRLNYRRQGYYWIMIRSWYTRQLADCPVGALVVRLRGWGAAAAYFKVR